MGEGYELVYPFPARPAKSRQIHTEGRARPGAPPVPAVPPDDRPVPTTRAPADRGGSGATCGECRPDRPGRMNPDRQPAGDDARPRFKLWRPKPPLPPAAGP